MSAIDIVRSHSLPIVKVKMLAQKTADHLAEHDLSSEWDGNTLYFKRSGLRGEMHVTGSEICLHITLGLLLRPIKGKLESRIGLEMDKWLGEQGAKEKKADRKKAPTGKHRAGA